MLRTVLAAFALASCAPAPTTIAPGDEAQIRSLDEQRRKMVFKKDIAGLEALAHADLAVNAPIGRILSRDELFADIRSGAIAAEEFTSTPERVRITGNVAVVMGRETFTPIAGSDLGRMYGAVQLNRRYTNVYLWEGGRWRWLARHANVVPPKTR